MNEDKRRASEDAFADLLKQIAKEIEIDPLDPDLEDDEDDEDE